MGKEFLKIIGQCFPTSNSLHKIFNKNTINLSYSCMPNLEVIIESDNKRKMQAEKQSKQESERKCNCQKSRVCPLNGECLAKDIIYQATVTSGTETETYVGLTATTFKARYANHKASFNSVSKRNATELSKHIWQLKDNNSEYAIKWKILSHAPHYSNRTKRCQLCITEKYFIICKRNCASLNKRNELISKCNHCDKFLLKNVKN